jgi:hypothetical protein
LIGSACSSEGADGSPPFTGELPNVGVGGSGTGVTPPANGGAAAGTPTSPGPAAGQGGTGGNPGGAGSGGNGTAGTPSAAGAANSGTAATGATAGADNSGAGGTASGAAGTASTPPPGVGCADASVLFCDDFETEALGAFPSAQGVLPQAGGCGSHTVDDSVPAHAGTRSLEATGAGYPGCMVHTDVSGQNELYIRSWVRLGAASTDSGHSVTVLELGPSSNQDDPEFRIGFRADAPCTDPGLDVTVGGLNAGEQTECSGFDLDPDRWYCLQAHMLKENGNVTFDVQVDGAAVVGETTYAGLSAAWSNALFFKFGRAAYGGNNTWSLWQDDVAIGTAPISCE